MFIYSVKANTLKLVAVILTALLALTFIAVTSHSDGVKMTKTVMTANEKIRYDKISSADDGADFLSQFGWEVDSTPLEESKVKLPSEFDKIITSYNELQKSQGLDLLKYKGREVMRYTYKVTNYENDDGTVLANLLVYKKRVIGGDICSSDNGGFIHGFAG